MILDPVRACPIGRWSAAVGTAGSAVDGVDGGLVLPTASVGKVFLLLTIADQLESGRLDPDLELSVTADDRVADSGVLQFLRAPRLPVADLAQLVGAVSDNLATNVLLRYVGLPAVQELTARIGLRDSALHDFVRGVRGPGDPPFLSSGCAGELAGVMARLATGDLVSPAASARVRGWLAANTDLSMVASAFSLDPLAHAAEDVGVTLVNKTGTNIGTRADVGFVTAGAGERTLSYAVIVRWSDDDYARRTAVLDAMRAVGHNVRSALPDA